MFSKIVLRADGSWVVNPSWEQAADAKLNLFYAGTEKAPTFVEVSSASVRQVWDGCDSILSDSSVNSRIFFSGDNLGSDSQGSIGDRKADIGSKGAIKRHFM